MNWKTAKAVLRIGEKITRPNWEPEHYWILSKDGFERILCYDGTNARVHLEQTEATDWELFKELKIETIQESMQRFICNEGKRPNKIRLHPNAIKIMNLKKENVIPKQIFGMDIIEDNRIKETEAIVCYEEERIKCFWCERYVCDIIEHTKERHPGLSPRSYDFIKEKLC